MYALFESLIKKISRSLFKLNDEFVEFHGRPATHQSDCRCCWWGDSHASQSWDVLGCVGVVTVIWLSWDFCQGLRPSNSVNYPT